MGWSSWWLTENRTPSQVLFLEFLNYLKKEKSLSPVAYYDVHIISCRLHRQTNLTSKFSEASKILTEIIIARFLCYSFWLNAKLHKKKFLNAKGKGFFFFPGISTRDILKTQSNTYNQVFFAEIVNGF